jgi:sugar lactone lactonase YvrE
VVEGPVVRRARTVLDDLVFTEGPRWHQESLWFSDMHDHRVVRVVTDEQGDVSSVSTVLEMPDDEPSGLGWLPDGRLLVVAMSSKQIRRLEPDGTVSVHADLAGHAVTGSINDMIVAADGTAYVGNMGYVVHGGSAARLVPAETWRVSPTGAVSLGSADMMAPNGHILTPDGHTLIVAESAASRLTAFSVGIDGALSGRRVFAQLTPAREGIMAAPPDGICLDAEGAVWVADPLGARVIRVREGGEVTDTVDIADGIPVACVLGGPERRTLYMCVAAHFDRDVLAGRRTGRIEAVSVEVPGAGRP